jgi:D-alanine-D-alanine ligase
MRLRIDRSKAAVAREPREFGRVAVLLGGTSTEREISLLTGNAVLAALKRRAVDAHPVDPRDTPLLQLVADGYDRVWIALQRAVFAAGTVQGSALGMDKLRTKRLAAASGLSTAACVVLRSALDCEHALQTLGLPMIVKPSTQGSSVGMSKVETAEQLEPAWRAAAATDDTVFAEPWITGAEYTVGVLQGRALPSIRIETPKTFYDYEAKYFRDDTRYFCPSGLSPEAEKHLGALALGAFDAVGASGWGRADFMMDSTGRPQLLEINTVPGMTDHSLVPMAARAVGVDFDQLVWHVLETSLARVRID